MDITQEINTIQKNAEKELGAPLNPQFWAIVENNVGNVATDYDGDPEGQEEYIESYRNVTKNYVMLVLTIHPNKAKASINGNEEQLKAKASINGNEEQPRIKKPYRGPLQRRLHLFEFVVKQKGRIRARANWKRITKKWNEEYPYDQKDWAILKMEYHRARNDSNVMKNYIALNVLPGLLEAMEKINPSMQEAMEKINEGISNLPKAMDKLIDFWQQHPEAKNAKELMEIEEAQQK